MFNGSLLVQVFLPVLIKNHWTLYVYDLANRRIQLLDSRPGRKKTMLSGVQQNLVKLQATTNNLLGMSSHKNFNCCVNKCFRLRLSYGWLHTRKRYHLMI